MTPTRTPEGSSGRCPLCGLALIMEPSEPLRDATCPACGVLVWPLVELECAVARTEPLNAEQRRSLQGLVHRLENPPKGPLARTGLLLDVAERLDLDVPDEITEAGGSLDDMLHWFACVLRKRLEVQQ